MNTMEHNREYSDAFFRLLNWAFFSKMSIYGLRENILLNYITETESYGRHFYRFFLFVIFCGLSFLSSCDWRYVPIDQIWLRFCNFKIIFQKYLKYFINILTKLFKSKVVFLEFFLFVAALSHGVVLVLGDVVQVDVTVLIFQEFGQFLQKLNHIKELTDLSFKIT